MNERERESERERERERERTDPHARKWTKGGKQGRW